MNSALKKSLGISCFPSIFSEKYLSPYLYLKISYNFRNTKHEDISFVRTSFSSNFELCRNLNILLCFTFSVTEYIKFFFKNIFVFQISSSQPSISMLTQAKTAKMTQPSLQTKMYKTWSMSCLRPAPPMRPSASERDALKSPRSGRKPGMRRKPGKKLFLLFFCSLCHSKVSTVDKERHPLLF